MNTGENTCSGTCVVSDVLRTLDDVTLCMSGGRYAEALALLRPFHECEVFSGWQDKKDPLPRRDARLRAMVMGVTADCYREMGEVERAALWYRRAFDSYRSGGYPAFYADMVLRHYLRDHYATALEALEESQRTWRATPLTRRIQAFARSHVWRSWPLLRLALRERGFAPELRRRLRDEGGNGTTADAAPPGGPL